MANPPPSSRASSGGKRRDERPRPSPPDAPARGASGRARNDPPDRRAELAGPLQRVLRRLPETQRRVLELRMGLADGHPHDLADTARAMGLSMSEARDIERRAFEHIREAIPLDQLQRFLER